MLATIGAWGGWQALRASMRWMLPLAAMIGVIVGFWLLVVAPRIELRRAEIEAQADQLQRTEDALKRVEAQAAVQREIDAEKVAAVDAAATARVERIERTTVLREAVAARAEASGDPEVSDGLDAFLADLRKEQGK